jgi:hypothetical protein
LATKVPSVSPSFLSVNLQLPIISSTSSLVTKGDTSTPCIARVVAVVANITNIFVYHPGTDSVVPTVFVTQFHKINCISEVAFTLRTYTSPGLTDEPQFMVTLLPVVISVLKLFMLIVQLEASTQMKSS